jgi:predicted transcriptional regulator
MSHALFDAIMDEKKLSIDAEVGALLGINRNGVSQYRSGHVAVGPAIVQRVYDVTGWTIEYIRELVADTTTPRVVRPRTAKQIAAAKRPRPKQKAAKPAKVAKPLKAKPVRAAKPVTAKKPATQNVPAKLTITKAPQWVSRVHRIV